MNSKKLTKETAILKYFEYKHLPRNLQKISEPFHNVAHYMNEVIEDDPEKEAGLRKLLEAKDCMMRAAL